MRIFQSFIFIPLCIALMAVNSATAAAPAANPDLNTGGAFESRAKSPATSRAVPPSEIDIEPLTGELLVDKKANSNQLVVRLDPRSTLLREELLRTVSASQLDTNAGLERAVIDVIRDQKDRSLLVGLGSPTSARYVIAASRDPLDARLQADERDPRERLQQSIIVRYASTQAALTALSLLVKSPYVLSAQMDYIIKPSSIATDPLYAIPSSPANAGVYQWGLHAMNFGGAWARTTGHAYVGIADAPIWPYNAANLLDFGTTSSPTIVNPDLRHNFRQQFAMLSTSVTASNWASAGPHGEHVVGIVAAGGSNSLGLAAGSGTVGGCPNCSVIVSGRRGSVATSSGHAESVYQLVDAGASIINLSANRYLATSDPVPACNSSDVSALAISYATNHDVLYVISSGNGNVVAGAQYPANCGNTLVVGAAENTAPSTPTSWQRWFMTSDDATSSTIVNGVYGVIAPGKHVLSTFNSSMLNHIPAFNCGTASPSDLSALGDLYGTCTGTSMAAPHVTALAGILRSASPLTAQSMIQTRIKNAGGLSPPTNVFFGWGMPNAASALNALIPVADAQNRLTPLFSMYSTGRTDYFYTTSPQMARAAFGGTLRPMANNVAHPYAMVGTAVLSYQNLPNTQWWQRTGAEAWLFTTPENPKSIATPLAPLFRMSFACNNAQYSNTNAAAACATNPQHTDTTYTTDQFGIIAFLNVGYRLDGIEGYIYPKNLAQPLGTVRLMRKYNATRDDHAIFPEPLSSQYQNEGYTLNSGSDWLGYVYQNINGSVPIIQ